MARQYAAKPRLGPLDHLFPEIATTDEEIVNDYHSIYPQETVSTVCMFVRFYLSKEC